MIIEVIKGGSPLTTKEKRIIKDIFIESKCPNESLKKSLKGFKSFDSRILYIDDKTGDKCGYSEELEV